MFIPGRGSVPGFLASCSLFFVPRQAVAWPTTSGDAWRGRSRHPGSVDQCAVWRHRRAIFVVIELAHQQIGRGRADLDTLLFDTRDVARLDIAQVQMSV